MDLMITSSKQEMVMVVLVKTMLFDTFEHEINKLQNHLPRVDMFEHEMETITKSRAET